ncbi:MAG: homoserine O-succinyltransferase [Parasporobacterium sp.]|nr:homoserine O-succinyltransferase [Parasporobacterium sp.]
MPIKVQNDLPAKAIIESENIFIIDEKKAGNQDIRPLEIGILNLMPNKEDTEIQLLRMLSNTPLQINVSFICLGSYISKHTPATHLNQFYEKFGEIKNKKFDGFIITGAPIELMEFEEVDYWDEFCEIMEWTKTHVTSTFHLCWAALAALNYHYGIRKCVLESKTFGVFKHKLLHRRPPIVRGFDDEFYAPHSRHTGIISEDVYNNKDLTVLAESDEAGIYLVTANNGKQVFVLGHPEYDRITLDIEYKRDLKKGMDIAVPKNYYPNDDPSKEPILGWRAHSSALYSNWLNYYVYQATPFDMEDIGK